MGLRPSNQLFLMTSPDFSTFDDDQWRKWLTDKQAEPLAFQVTRHAATELPFTGKFNSHWERGHYACVCCGQRLFESQTKFDAGCGWPSFYQAIDDTSITERRDHSHGMVRVETLCSNCGAHLGHVFPDGPQPTGLRYCMNSAALDFDPES